MKAIELKLADGTGTGSWYCLRCKEIQRCFEGNNPEWASEEHRARAERCCTGRETWLKCSGCRKNFKFCNCGRAKLNSCIGCSGKLMFREGVKVRWGAEIREVCYFCAKEVPASTLMDATEIGDVAASLTTWALTAPDTSLSTLAPKTGAEKGPVVKPDSISLKDQKRDWIWKR